MLRVTVYEMNCGSSRICVLCNFRFSLDIGHFMFQLSLLQSRSFMFKTSEILLLQSLQCFNLKKYQVPNIRTDVR